MEDRQEPILIVSDSDGDNPMGNFNAKMSKRDIEASMRRQNRAQVQWVPRLVSPMLHKVQHWDVENRTLIQSGQLVEVMDKGEIRVACIALGEAELGDNGCRAQVSADFLNPGCVHGMPGSGNALALSGLEEHITKAGHGRPAIAPGHTVGVSTPLRHREEERVRPGAAHPTSGEAPSSSQVFRRRIPYDEPSTSQSASGLTKDIGSGEEFLDFDEVNETVVLVGGLQKELGGQGNNKSWSFGVLQDQRKAAVRSDRQGGERSLSSSAVNLPRGEERPFISGFEGAVELGSAGRRARVQNMGVQTSSLDNDVVSSKVADSEVSILSGKAEPERFAQNQGKHWGECKE
ncbi:hypothetical protein NDU88_002418 [Pleurodeles waltl]|uniref:Uncharacterized protein n=1 Tax=Pleurodeles waltl TaxID=8319 RepID=A0AAV7M5X9_PLEWA|nr:hypothetical protein NDU88_002418 [Pleurodeles waltl]